MLLRLLPTLACLSLINGGLYALHLTGSNTNSNSAASSPSSPLTSASLADTDGAAANHHHSVNNKNGNMLLSSVASTSQQQQHSSHPPGGGGSFSAKQFESMTHSAGGNSNFGDQIADMAQLERERLMLLGLAKQTAAAGSAATGHHGRPIVTGRIQMTPTEVEDESGTAGDYPSLFLQQAARGFMFGNVVKQAAPHYVDGDYDSAEDYVSADGSTANIPRRYEYGRIVQPPLERHHYVAPSRQQHEFDDFAVEATDADDDAAAAAAFDLDMDAFGDEDVEDGLPDIDGYQYLDELLAEQQQQHDWQQHQPTQFFHAGSRQQNPFHTFDELTGGGNPPPQALQELFEQEQQKQHDAKQKHNGVSSRNGKQHYDIRMQQKWQRKRAQQQQQQQQREHQQKFFNNQQRLGQSRAQQKHFGLHPNSNKKLTLASALNAEVAAVAASTKKQQQQQHSSSTSSSGKAKQQQTDQAAAAAVSAASASNAAVTATDAAKAAENNSNNNKLSQQQQQQQHIMHPNHKRSGIGAGTMLSPPPPPPPVSHSIASQLMLRTVRGQRQYDVPQIECPNAPDGMERFACPTPDLQGRYRCIDDHVLCDGFIDCPEGEDEDRRSCMFYKTTKAHLDVLADALLRWARGR